MSDRGPVPFNEIRAVAALHPEWSPAQISRYLEDQRSDAGLSVAVWRRRAEALASYVLGRDTPIAAGARHIVVGNCSGYVWEPDSPLAFADGTPRPVVADGLPAEYADPANVLDLYRAHRSLQDDVAARPAPIIRAAMARAAGHRDFDGLRALAEYARIRSDRDHLAGTVELCCLPVDGEAHLADRIRAAGDAQRELQRMRARQAESRDRGDE